VEAADEGASYCLNDVKRVPRVVRSRNVVEEQEDTRETEALSGRVVLPRV